MCYLVVGSRQGPLTGWDLWENDEESLECDSGMGSQAV